ncbi:hypothetical protein CDEN61S_00793 [Castellaniella denitrificans]
MPGDRLGESKIDLHGFIEDQAPPGFFFVLLRQPFDQELHGWVKQYRRLGLLDEGEQHPRLTCMMRAFQQVQACVRMSSRNERRITSRTTLPPRPAVVAAHRLTVATIQGKDHLQGAAVVTAELEPVRTPTLIALLDRNLAVMAPCGQLSLPAALQQQTVVSHHPIDPLDVDGRCTMLHPVPAHQRPDPAIAVAGELPDVLLDFLDQPAVLERAGLAAITSTRCLPSIKRGDRVRGFGTLLQCTTNTPRNKHSLYNADLGACMSCPYEHSYIRITQN